MITSIYQEEVKTPLRFHRSKDLINENKANCYGHCDYYLIMPEHYLVDIMILRPVTNSPISDFQVISTDGLDVYYLNVFTLAITQYEDKEYIMYSSFDTNGAINNLGLFELSCNKTYNIYIKDADNNEWWSETFRPAHANGDGIELVANGKFENVLPPWTTSGGWGIISHANGTFAANKPNLGGATLQQSINIPVSQIGKPYILEFDVQAYSGGVIGGHLYLYLDGVNYADITNTGHYRYVLPDTIANIQPYEIKFMAQQKWLGNVANVTLQYASLELDCYYKLQWSAQCNIGNMAGYRFNQIFQRPFTNKYWIDKEAELSAPEYTLTQEGVENDGKFVATYTRRAKILNILTGLIPEYVVDCLFEAQLYPHESVRLYHKYKQGFETVQKYTFKYEWEWNGACLANGTCTLDIDDTAIKTGCCDGIDTFCIGICDELGDGVVPLTLNNKLSWSFPIRGPIAIISGVSYVRDNKINPWLQQGDQAVDNYCGDSKAYTYHGVWVHTKLPDDYGPYETTAAFYYDNTDKKWKPLLPLSAYYDDPSDNPFDLSKGTIILTANPVGTLNNYLSTARQLDYSFDTVHWNTYLADPNMPITVSLDQSIEPAVDILASCWVQRYMCEFAAIYSPAYRFRAAFYIEITITDVIGGYIDINGNTYFSQVGLVSGLAAIQDFFNHQSIANDTSVLLLPNGNIAICNWTTTGQSIQYVFTDMAAINKINAVKKMVATYDTYA
jgi:hypothetical protein